MVGHQVLEVVYLKAG